MTIMKFLYGKKEFRFNDIASINDCSLQKILYEFDNSELANTLVSADVEVRNKIIGNVSERRAAHIKKCIEEKIDSDKHSQERTQQKIISVLQDYRNLNELVTTGIFMFPGDSPQSNVDS